MSPPQDRSVDRPVPTPGDVGVSPAAVVDAAGSALGYLTFWTAVCLPVLLVALLATGIETAAQARAFLVVTGLECVALALGRIHFAE